MAAADDDRRRRVDTKNTSTRIWNGNTMDKIYLFGAHHKKCLLQRINEWKFDRIIGWMDGWMVGGRGIQRRFFEIENSTEFLLISN